MYSLPSQGSNDSVQNIDGTHPLSTPRKRRVPSSITANACSNCKRARAKVFSTSDWTLLCADEGAEPSAMERNRVDVVFLDAPVTPVTTMFTLKRPKSI